MSQKNIRTNTMSIIKNKPYLGGLTFQLRPSSSSGRTLSKRSASKGRSGSTASRAESLTKQEIRSKILLRLKTQKEEDRERKSRAVKNKLFRSKVFKKAKIIMFYISFDGEVNTEEMIKEAQKLGKIIAVPFCKGNSRAIYPCLLHRKAKLRKGLYGVCEPAVKRRIDLRDIDLVIVPGIAFDKEGRRLGRGKGCYDWFLKKIPKDTPSIGLAFGFQILPYIPAFKSDCNVSKVLSA